MAQNPPACLSDSVMAALIALNTVICNCFILKVATPLGNHTSGIAYNLLDFGRFALIFFWFFFLILFRISLLSVFFVYIIIVLFLVLWYG